jgi:hypothetical protein
MGLNGIELIQDCSIELTIGRRYGLIGQNGCGKTNFLQCLANREVGPCVDNITRACGLAGTCVLVLLPPFYAASVAIVCTCWLTIHGVTPLQRRGARPPSIVEVPSCCSAERLRRFPQVPIPDHMDLYHLSEEVEPTPRTALETVVDYIKNEIDRLNKLEEHILETVGPEDERLQVGAVSVCM